MNNSLAASLIVPVWATVNTYFSCSSVIENAAQGGARFAGKDPGFIYTRLGNPTNRMVEEKVAFLEGAGAALSAGSGMGAIAAALWTALKAGDHVVAADSFTVAPLTSWLMV